jgi:hypothetical protein
MSNGSATRDFMSSLSSTTWAEESRDPKIYEPVRMIEFRSPLSYLLAMLRGLH